MLNEARARGLAESLGDSTFTVRSVEEKPYKSSPKAPFMTSTLQQEGGRKLRLSSSQVMRVAQGLYERGFITYMRTDNVILSDEAMNATRAAITERVRVEVPQRRTEAVQDEVEERPGSPRGDPADDAVPLARRAVGRAEQPGDWRCTA